MGTDVGFIDSEDVGWGTGDDVDVGTDADSDLTLVRTTKRFVFLKQTGVKTLKFDNGVRETKFDNEVRLL